MLIAAELKEKLDTLKSELIEKTEVVKPGYINLFLKEKVLIENLKKIFQKKSEFGKSNLLKNKRIMVEFAHPNPFKVMHIGHLRNIFLGESIVRLLESQGAEVIRTNYQGDVGMHVAKCVWALKRIHKEEYPETVEERVALLSKTYALGAKAFEENKESREEIVNLNKEIYQKTNPEVNELWQLGVKWSLDKFHQIYERVYSYFEREYLESETLSFIDEEIKLGLEMGVLIKSEGAIIMSGEKYGVDTRVFINSKGFPTYEGKQLGLVVHMEFKDFGKIDKIIFNVAVEQISFFKTTIKAVELLHPELKGKQYHNAYEFVGLKKGKMSSRKGLVVTAESILNEARDRIAKVVEKNQVELKEGEVDKIGIAAVKYGFLKMSPFKYLAFDIDASISFSGDSGPYLQYTYARARSILRKAKVNEEELGFKPIGKVTLNDEELKILKKLIWFPEIVELATLNYSPNYIATYLNELAQLFNNFYVKHQVKNNNLRLALTTAVGEVIKNGLYLLGIKSVERM
jgi:arginyl-tRNA synthetase